MSGDAAFPAAVLPLGTISFGTVAGSENLELPPATEPLQGEVSASRETEGFPVAHRLIPLDSTSGRRLEWATAIDYCEAGAVAATWAMLASKAVADGRQLILDFLEAKNRRVTIAAIKASPRRGQPPHSDSGSGPSRTTSPTDCSRCGRCAVFTATQVRSTMPRTSRTARRWPSLVSEHRKSRRR